MANSLGSRLPDEVRSLLAPAAPTDQLGKLILAITRDGSGFPHVMALSLGEVFAAGDGGIRLVVAQEGSAARNLGERPELTIVLIDRGLCCYVKGLGTVTGAIVEPSPLQPFPAVRVDVAVVDVLLDSEAGAAVESGPRYSRDVPPAEELAHWARLREVLSR